MPCNRPVHSQPPHGDTALQDGDTRVRPICHQKSGVDGVDRHTGCLSSCTDASRCPQVSAFRGQQEGVPVHLSSVWTGDFSTGVHQAAETCRVQGEVDRCHVHALGQGEGPLVRVPAIQDGPASTAEDRSVTTSVRISLVKIRGIL